MMIRRLYHAYEIAVYKLVFRLSIDDDDESQ